jgi:hypothetical protein
MTRPDSAACQLSSTARAIDAAALPAPMTRVRPLGQGGNFPGIRFAG